MANYRTDSEEEALFRNYPYALYYVQSPSTPNSHANNLLYDHIALYDNSSPIPSQEATTARLLALSRYSNSSRGSNNSFMHDNEVVKQKIFPHEQCDHVENAGVLDELNGDQSVGGGIIRNGGVDARKDDGDDDDQYEYDCDDEGKGWVKYFSFSYSNSCSWICLQLGWRFLLSLMIALIVFYSAAKPPAPRMSVKMAGIREFRLGEGVDASGVTTKVLSFNCSMNLTIDNKSKLFGLHIHPPIMEMFFGHLSFAFSQGKELYAGNNGLTPFKLSVGTTNKAMYGAGRNMQDLLQSGKGLPLVVRVRFRSRFHVVRGLFEPKYRHEAQCLLLLRDKYDKKHRTQVYSSRCLVT